MVNVPRYLCAALLVALAAGLGACAVPYDYRNIQPTWAVRNSPVPVPHPVRKPITRTAKVASAPTKSLWTAASVKSSPAVIRVKAGDSVYGLARRYDVPPSQIIALNKLYAPYHLNKGMPLRLKQASKPASKPRVVKTVQRSVPTVTQTQSYRVKRGDTLYAIAKRAKATPGSIAALNGLHSPYALNPGQVLRLPKTANVAAPIVRTAQLSPQAGTATFIWPANGKVISGYGVKANGLRNDGINIAADKGAPVYAAAAGEVLYAGDRLRAFGNLVLIRHKNGFISTYGHNSTLFVYAGQQVVQGERIATVGATGNVAAPQVHFELRRNSSAIDPMRYLGRSQMAANSR